MKSEKSQSKPLPRKYRALIRAVVLAIIVVLIYLIGRRLGAITEIPKFSLNAKAAFRGILIVLALFAAEGLILFLLSLPRPKNNRARTLFSLTKNILRYAAVLAAICVALTIFNVDVVTILAGLGIIALIIGFGAESLIADIVTGMFILIDNQYNIGDIIEVNGFRGTVTEINVRSTVLTDGGGNVKIINNSDMKNILNRSDNTSKSVTEFPIPYETDLLALEKQLPEILAKIYEDHRKIMRAKPVYIGIDRLDENAMVLKFVVDVDEPDVYAVTRIMTHDLLIAMQEFGIRVPYPQLDVHTK